MSIGPSALRTPHTAGTPPSQPPARASDPAPGPRKPPGFAAYWAVLAVLLVPWAVWVSWLPHLHELAAQAALDRAQAEGALLYRADFGLSPVVFVACWIVSSVLVLLAVESTWPELWNRRLVFGDGVVKIHPVEALEQGAATGAATGAARGAARERSPGARGPAPVQGLKPRRRKSWGLWLAALVLKSASAGFVVLDLRGHAVITAEAYLQWPRLPGFAVVARPLSTVALVELGCSRLSAGRRERERNRIVYDLHFTDGALVHLYDTRPVQGAWVDAAQHLDQTLRGSGARFARWDWLGQQPLHPSCLRWFQDTWTAQEYARLQGLLRIGDGPTAN